MREFTWSSVECLDVPLLKRLFGDDDDELI